MSEKTDRYCQCLLVKGDERTIGWIHERGAKIDALVEIEDYDSELWRVEQVFEPIRNMAWIRENQRKNNNTCKSIK